MALHRPGHVAGFHAGHDLLDLLDRLDDGIHRVVDALDDAAEVAGMASGVGPHVEPAVGGGIGQGPGVLDQSLQVAAHLLDGAVDEGLLAGQLHHRRIEVAVAEGLEAGHGLLLDRDVCADHRIDAFGHRAEIAIEAAGIDHHVDVAALVLGRHVVHLGDQALEIAPDLLDRVVDEGLLARQLRHRGIEIALAELVDHADRHLLDRDVRGHQVIDALRHLAQLAAVAAGIDDDIDVALVMLRMHAGQIETHLRDGVDQLVDGGGGAVQMRRQRRCVDPLREVALGGGLDGAGEMALDRVLFALGLVDALDLEHGGLLRRSGPQRVQTVALQGLDHGGRRLEDLEGAA